MDCAEASSPANSTASPRRNSAAALLAAVPAAAIAPDDPHRERADVADLIKHVRVALPQMPSPMGGRPSSPSQGGSALGAPLLSAVASSALPRPAAILTHVSRLDVDDTALTPNRRATSWCDAEHRLRTAPEVNELRRQLCQPGGFRRGHLHAHASAGGMAPEQRPAQWSKSLLENLAQSASLYQRSFGMSHCDENGESCEASERELDRFVGGLGKFSLAVAIFKANIGTNILFVPHAFMEGGFVLAFLFMTVLAALSVVCVDRLIATKRGVKESFGDIMERAVGPKGRFMVNLCIVLYQCGTCCCYIVNIGNMMHESFFETVNPHIVMCCVAGVAAPMVLIRNVAKLSPINVFGGLMTIIGVAATITTIGTVLAADGVQEVAPFRAAGWLKALGIACYTFEGIGLAIPIYESARHPESYMWVYAATISFIMVLISTVGVMGNFAYGMNTNTLILINLKPGAVGSTIRVLFSLVMLSSFPLQMLPAIRIVESLVLSPSRPGTCDKHAKSAFRILFVATVAVVAIGAASSLDNFVSLVGVVCGLPLCFICPAICHLYLLAERGSFGAITDVCFVLVGMVMVVVVGTSSIVNWGK